MIFPFTSASIGELFYGADATSDLFTMSLIPPVEENQEQ